MREDLDYGAMMSADGVEIKFPNLPEFKAQLQAFGAEFETKTVRAGVVAAGQIFKKYVLRQVPVLRPTAGRHGPMNRTSRRVAGTLKRSIFMARSKKSTRGTTVYVVSFKKRRKELDPFYGRFLEEGWIPRGPGRALRGGDRSKNIIRSRESHKKITRYSFIKPAFDLSKHLALDAFEIQIQRRIDKENAKRILK